MENKNEYMLLFRYEPNNDHQPTEAEMNEMHQQWGAYFGSIAGQGNLVSTHQLGFEGVQIGADSSITDGILFNEKQMVSGNLVINASSLDEAIAVAKQCPILQMGGNIEVRSTIPM